MVESGRVTAVKGETAKVKVDKKDECSKCGMCLFPQNASSIEFDAQNQIGAKMGDLVEIEKKSDGKLLGTLLAFLVPLLLIGLAVLINYLFIKKEIFILVIAIGLIAVWYIVLALIDKKIKKLERYTTVITKILEKNTQGEI